MVLIILFLLCGISNAYAVDYNFLAASKVFNGGIQGHIYETSSRADLAINGAGLFALRGSNGKLLFTRVGSFFLNSKGYLAHRPSGLELISISSEGKRDRVSLKNIGIKNDSINLNKKVSLQGFDVSEDGVVKGLYSDGKTAVLAKIFLALFQNRRELLVFNQEKHLLRSTELSGGPNFVQPGKLGLTGKIYSQYLESVDKKYYKLNFNI